MANKRRRKNETKFESVTNFRTNIFWSGCHIVGAHTSNCENVRCAQHGLDCSDQSASERGVLTNGAPSIQENARAAQKFWSSRTQCLGEAFDVESPTPEDFKEYCDISIDDGALCVLNRSNAKMCMVVTLSGSSDDKGPIYFPHTVEGKKQRCWFDMVEAKSFEEEDDELFDDTTDTPLMQKLVSDVVKKRVVAAPRSTICFVVWMEPLTITELGRFTDPKNPPNIHSDITTLEENTKVQQVEPVVNFDQFPLVQHSPKISEGETSSLSAPGGFLCSQAHFGPLTHAVSPYMFFAYDFDAEVGTELAAVGDARVVEVKQDAEVYGPDVRNLFDWNEITLELTATKLLVEYVHIQRSFVNVGDVVKSGSIIGTSGRAGFTPTPHLHIQVVNENKVSVPFTIQGEICEPGKWYGDEIARKHASHQSRDT